MDKFEHKYIEVDGLKLHIAEIGSPSSPTVIFLHGFPEIWYTWRHQMIAVANAGFRAIAPDYRGYGLSDKPAEPQKTLFSDVVKDIATIVGSLGISKVFVIGKDFGAMVAYGFAMFSPKQIKGIVTLNMPFIPPSATKQFFTLPEGFYIRRWQEPGRAEADFSRFDAKTVVRNIYIMFAKSELPIASENQEVMDLVEPSASLPSWFTEEDLTTYADLYDKSGFQTALQVPYRSLDEEISFMEDDPKLEAPAMLIIGEQDYFVKLPGMVEYATSGAANKYVPNLEVVTVPQGSHFVHEQFPDKVNKLILDFLNHNN